MLTKRLHQKSNAGCVCGHRWTHGGVDAHIRQHPDQLHQHVVSHLWSDGRRGSFLHDCVRWLIFSLVDVVQPEKRAHAAVALKELQPGLIAFGREIPEGEEEAHDEILQTSGGDRWRNISLWI